MNRKKFMRNLRLHLTWRMPAQELESIVGDYAEFFAAGQEEGLDEAQLLSSLSTPNDLQSWVMNLCVVSAAQLLPVLLLPMLCLRKGGAHG